MKNNGKFALKIAFSFWLVTAFLIATIILLGVYIGMGVAHGLNLHNFYIPFLAYLGACCASFPMFLIIGYLLARTQNHIVADGKRIDFEVPSIEIPYSHIKRIKTKKFVLIYIMNIDRGLGFGTDKSIVFESSNEMKDFLAVANLTQFVAKKR